ncbi:conjugal transfer protein [Shimazuella kribbensis]|uniref:conjugal transfer protein n=1 Tax=Shimazuella kribbensis TaxID=139808 RepID=UPI000423EF5D|nr:conjugal transfer protein [Shimazuella kribbensis]
MNPTLNERMKAIGRIFIYFVLVIFLIGNVVIVFNVLTNLNKPVVQQQTSTTNEVPDTAKSVVKLFLQNWYNLNPDLRDEDRIENLQPFVTPVLYDYINRNADLRIVDDTSVTDPPAGSQQTTPPNTSTTPPNTSTTPPKGGEQTFKGVSTTEVDIWQSKWIDQKANKVQIIARMQTSDDKTLFLSLPVEKSGNTWQVSSLPSLIAEPKGVAKQEEEPDPIDINAKQAAIKTMLDSFFTDWLEGNSEGTRRYMFDGKQIASTDWEEKLNAKFVGVQSITALSDNPLKVKVVISMKDSNNMEFQLDYHMTLEEKNGQWYIRSID